MPSAVLNLGQSPVRQKVEREDQHQRKTIALAIVLAVLVVALIGTSWFAYPVVRDHKKAVAEMIGLQGIANTLGVRMESVEASVGKMTAGLPSLADRMDQLQASMKTNLAAARKQAQTVATQVGQRIQEDVNRSMLAVQSRMEGVESNQKEAAERVNQLQEQVAGLQRQLATMREEASTSSQTIKELRDSQQTSTSELSGELSGLNSKLATNQAALTSLNNRMDRKRVDFDVQGRQIAQIAPGINLTVRRFDAGKQEIDGTVQLEGMNMPIRAQGIKKPVVFYLQNETRPVELVLTQVSKNGVSGYVSLPAFD